MSLVEKGLDVYKSAKKVTKKITKTVKFLLTPIGHIIGILLLVAVLIVIIYVLSESVQHAIGMWFDDDYAGIATTEDYETIVGGIGYAGYDSFISEEKWQEYAAYEYAVLMDVAEHIYTYQDCITPAEDNGEKTYTSAVFPEGKVESQYDAYSISKDEWRNMAIQGQGGSAPNMSNSTKIEKLGGNRDVTTPRLIYETAGHEYEDTVSLMPYIVIVRENLELNYFLQDLNASKEYGHLEEIAPQDLSSINPVRYSAELNRFNYNMPNSAYKKDYAEDQENGLVVGLEDPEGFIDADRDDVGYGADVYYTEQENDIVYKVPLKLLINRYLPKSTLLTTWYMLKQDDMSGNGFKIDEMMEAIKDVYNAACYTNGMSSIPSIQTTGRKDENGNIDTSISEIIRTGKENIETVTITDAIQYDEYGAIVRDEDGNPILKNKTESYATTNKRTFIYFEQFGLETSRYESFKAYTSTNGKYEPQNPDEANPNPDSAVATYLTRERVNFIETLNMHLPNIRYYDEYGEIQVMDLDVRLKPTYSFMQEPGVELDEKFKSMYIQNLYGGNTGAGYIQQDAPYNFMGVVVTKAEGKINNREIYKLIDENSERDETIYDHHVINQYYMIAEDGNVGNPAAPNGNQNPELVGYRLPEDFRYYNQDNRMPHWYDLKEYSGTQGELENKYLEAFKEVYGDSAYEEEILTMISNESGIPKDRIISFSTSGVRYTYNTSANLYRFGRSKHIVDMNDALTGNYKINYYWKAIYDIKEKKLEVKQTVHHVRMPALLVKYCDFWAKSVEYTNRVVQNPIDYKSYKHLIPNSVTSLGLQKMDLEEKASYRVGTFAKFFNKADASLGDEGIKEGDVLDMLVQWEEYANKGGDESAYAYMRELYKLVINIRDHANTMLNTAYNYLYIPPTISNYDDSTLQKIFWLERLGVSEGDDELTLEEQSKTRAKALDTRWQNLEYDEYHECIYDVGSEEEARVYALFPFGAPVIRSYYMLRDWNELISNGYSGSHKAVDMYSRAFATDILNRGTEEGKLLYYYELNRLTLSYMQNGNSKEDAFMLAEKTLNSQLESYELNSPIVAIAPGYVTQVDYDARSGFYVQITHDSGDKSVGKIQSLYVHLKRWPLVEVGDVVGAGTILGYEGTTGRSTGNHLHIQLKVNGQVVNPQTYIMPVFSPFYYDKKSTAVLEENAEKALGSEYYTLERTILPEIALFNKYNVINGMTLKDGTVIEYKAPTNQTTPYKSGDSYDGSAYDVYWGNNVPSGELARTLDGIIDLKLLNQKIEYEAGKFDNPSGEKLYYNLTNPVSLRKKIRCSSKSSIFLQ